MRVRIRACEGRKGTVHRYVSRCRPQTPKPYEFDPLHADGIKHADLDAGVRMLNEVIYECQRSLAGIEPAGLDLEAQANA